MFMPILNSDLSQSGYFIDEFCNVIDSLGNIVSQSYNMDGRPFISLVIDGKRSVYLTYRLMLIAHGLVSFPYSFYNNCDACHINEDKPLNNNLSNLKWGSHADNMKDAANNNRMPYGENHHNSTYSTDIIINICMDLKNKTNFIDIANKYNVDKNLPRDILRGVSHRREAEECGLSIEKFDTAKRNEIVTQVCVYLEQGLSCQQICDLIPDVPNACYVSDIKFKRKGRKISDNYNY